MLGTSKKTACRGGCRGSAARARRTPGRRGCARACAGRRRGRPAARRALCVWLGEERQCVACRDRQPSRHRGIDSDAAAGARLAELLEEVALAAADLDHVSPAEPVPFDEPCAWSSVAAESRRECLTVFVVLGVVDEPGVEGGVGHEAAAGADREADCSERKRLGLRAAADEPQLWSAPCCS